jgi:hypothetical protein
MTVTINVIVVVTLRLVVIMIIMHHFMSIIVAKIFSRAFIFIVGVRIVVIGITLVTMVGRIAGHLYILPCIIITWEINREYVTGWSFFRCAAPVPRLFLFEHNIA